MFHKLIRIYNIYIKTISVIKQNEFADDDGIKLFLYHPFSSSLFSLFTLFYAIKCYINILIQLYQKKEETFAIVGVAGCYS